MIVYDNRGTVVFERWSRPDIDGGKEHVDVFCVTAHERDAFVIVNLLNKAVEQRAYPFQADARVDSNRS